MSGGAVFNALVFTYLIKALFCKSSLLKFNGISSESTTPLTNRNHLGTKFAVFDCIRTLRVYNATPTSPSRVISNRPGLPSGKYSKARMLKGTSVWKETKKKT